jgi:hypothetical protein
MIRVSKGSRGRAGKPKLVCSRAKAGAGCEYVSVPQDHVEWPLFNRPSQLLDLVPSGNEELADEIRTAEANLNRLVELTTDTADEVVRTKSPSLREKLTELEAAYDVEKTRKAQLESRYGATHPPLVAQRVAELARLLPMSPIDRTRINLLLRQLFSKVVIDPRNGILRFAWKQGGETRLTCPALVFRGM